MADDLMLSEIVSNRMRTS